MAEFTVTSGHGYSKLPLTVPSWFVATVVKWIILKLSPVMSWIFIFFQRVCEVASPSQTMEHVWPSA